ncbi:nitroreductase family protein [Chitinophagaceae bacterium MMS25-I14]
MNNVIEIIRQRRAIRKYKNAPVDRILIEQLLTAGRMAPSAMNRQPWKFYIVTDRDKIKLFSQEISHIALKEVKHMAVKDVIKTTLSFFHLSDVIHFLNTSDHIFYEAPVVIFIAAATDDDWAPLDIGMCAQNIMLAAKSLGLDTCPVGFGKFVTDTEHYSLLKIPDNEDVLLAITVGYGDEHPKAHARIEDNAVYI